jgi:general secretion pathway protein G
MARGRSQRGFTFIELMVTVAVVIVLAGAAIPVARWDQKRRAENRLRVSLRTMREAIDKYHELVGLGQIVQTDVEQMGYPLDLDELVDGVKVVTPDLPEGKTIKLLQRIPVDPFTDEAEWGKRSYQDDWDSTGWGGENVYDVYSLSLGKALDGTYYKDW